MREAGTLPAPPGRTPAARARQAGNAPRACRPPKPPAARASTQLWRRRCWRARRAPLRAAPASRWPTQ
eukprot:108859-Chlamydomonas_euryale.AAC.1